MKNLTPNGLALRISFLVAIVVTLFLSVFGWANNNININLVLLIFPITFVASYIGFRLAVEKFIYSKIKLIYKTIHNLKLEKGDAGAEIDLNTDVLNQVKEDVEAWDKTNKQEIERLKGLEEYRREFVGNVSHELKTPIFNVQGYILTLLEGGLDDPNINLKYLDRANKSVDRMIRLLDDLDEISKLESGVLEMEFTKVDLVDLVKEAIISLEIGAKKNNITLKFVDEPIKPIWVMANVNAINQVFINLIVNSIKYGKDGGETLVKLFDMHDNILIEIADDGGGIAEEHLPRLFERFYRTDTARDRGSGGTGLGLSIVKHIIEAHHQTVNVRSTIDVGSTFSFTLKKA